MGERVSASEGTLSWRGAGAMTGTSVGDPPDGGGGEEHRAIEPEDNRRRALRSHATFCRSRLPVAPEKPVGKGEGIKTNIRECA